jgi:hypothetical protein
VKQASVDKIPEEPVISQEQKTINELYTRIGELFNELKSIYGQSDPRNGEILLNMEIWELILQAGESENEIARLNDRISELEEYINGLEPTEREGNPFAVFVAAVVKRLNPSISGISGVSVFEYQDGNRTLTGVEFSSDTGSYVLRAKTAGKYNSMSQLAGGGENEPGNFEKIIQFGWALAEFPTLTIFGSTPSGFADSYFSMLEIIERN